MINVREMKEDNEATAQIREEVRKSWGRQEAPFWINVPIESDTFRDPAEMVTISADRFEGLIRRTESYKQEILNLNEKIDKAHQFIDTVAREWAEKGSVIPSYEDLSRMAVILGWKESDDIRDIRTTQRMLKDRCLHPSKEVKEAANNGEASD